MERLDQAKQDAERSTPPPAGKGKEREAIPSQVRESSSIYKRNILIAITTPRSTKEKWTLISRYLVLEPYFMYIIWMR